MGFSTSCKWSENGLFSYSSYVYVKARCYNLRMKKVFILHGFESSPLDGWRPWLLDELQRKGIYGSALAMPDPSAPILHEWIAELDRQITMDQSDEIYLVGHSLGATTILRYLESDRAKMNIAGAVLVSGPCEPVGEPKIDDFLKALFRFDIIKEKIGKVSIIHGDNDRLVPLAHAHKLSKELEGELIIIQNGGHLSGTSKHNSLQACMDALEKMFD